MANFLQLLNVAWKIFRRDWRRKDLLILLFSVSIAMTSISVIYLVTDRLQSATTRGVADVLGADLVISSPRKIESDWLNFATKLNLQQAISVEFSSVLFANEHLQLSNIKAVSDNYPLKGRLEIADAPYGESRATNQKPPAGKIWIEPRLYSILEAEKGSQVEVGYAELTVDGAIMLQPGQGSTLFNIAPSAIISIDDLERTKVVQPGSRVNYRYLFSGNAEAIKQFTGFVKPKLVKSQRLLTIFDESPVAGSAIERSKKYIGLSSLLTVILLGVAIAMSANRYARRQFDMSALMRCFGLTNHEVLTIFVLIIMFVCSFGLMAGTAFGVAGQELIVLVIERWLPESLPMANYSVLLLPAFAASVLLIGFSLPALIQLKRVPPMRVLRRQLLPMNLAGWSIYLMAAATLMLVMWMQIRDLTLLLNVMLGLIAVALVFTLLAWLLLKLMKQMAHSRNAAVNFSLRQLEANKGVTLLHLLAFSITLFVIALLVIVRGELLAKWQQSLGDDIPNHFMVNLKAEEVEPIKTLLTRNQISITEVYPMVRGRITGVNGKPASEAIPESGQEHNSLKRELNITWAEKLPEGNKITAGQWLWPERPTEPLISIEEKTASTLGLKLGDVIDFSIGAVSWHGKIVSIRSIDWQTFTPNFYVIANPGALDNFSATYIGSFRLPKDKKGILAELVKKHPSVTVIELDRILEEVQLIIEKVSTAVELIMAFVVIAGIALLWATMEHTFDSKYRQSAILRTLGADKSFIARSFRFEYFWLAMLSSVMAIAAVESISFLLYKNFFEIDFEFHWSLWMAMPVATLTLMLTASWRGVNRVTAPSPMLLIRQG